jgi:hypothetical protein
MLRAFREWAVAVVAGLAVALSSLAEPPGAHATSIDVTVDGGRRYQTISALGADINPHSWDNGNLKPALDLLIDKGGMKTFRVGMDMLDWESSNDNSDPRTFNWSYYDPIYSGQTSFDTQYAGSNFANTWHVIDYLRHKGVPARDIELSFMGPGASWMGGSSLTSGKEAEFVEEVVSAAYYGYRHGHTFGLFSPDNEMDISSNEGVQMSDTQYADVLNRVARRMNALGMTRVKLVGPESCCTTGYAEPMKKYPTLMAKLAHFDFHNYNGDDNGAAAVVAGTGKGFWISEFANFDQAFTYLDQGAAGLLMWEAYDSVYNHAVLNGRGSDPGNDSLSFGDIPLLAYHPSTRTYTPRSEFYFFAQLFKWVPIGSRRIYASSASGVKIEAFHDPATSRLTLVGDNNSGSSQTVSIALEHLAAPTVLRYYRTNLSTHLARGADVRVRAGSATVTVPADTTFTLTGRAPVRLSGVQYDSPGQDTGTNVSLNREWARITNHGTSRRTLTGWTVGDREGNVYRFRTFVLRSGRSVTLHTGRGRNTATDLFWGRTRYAWKNTGDTATLKNRAGTTVGTCRWGDGTGSITC